MSRQINVPVSDATYDAAKEAAEAAGMKFRTWVERAVLTQAKRESKPTEEPADETVG